MTTAPAGDAPLSDAKRVLLEQRRRGCSSAAPPAAVVTRRARTGPVRLSGAQQQVWYASQLVSDTTVYNEVVSIRKDGPLDVAALQRAVDEVVRRHEAWRTTFSLVDGEPSQIVHPDCHLKIPLADLSEMLRDRAVTAAERMVAELAAPPFRLDTLPLMRARLIRFSQDHHRLYLCLHHIIFDGVSLHRIVLPELIAIYDAAVTGRPSPLQEPPVQCADYALSELDAEAANGTAAKLEYWRRRLADVPALSLPLDRPRPRRQRFSGGMETLDIPEPVVRELRAIARDSGATLFQIAAAVFAVLLHRYSGQDEVVFATVADLRSCSELEGMVGYCSTPLPLRIALDGDPTASSSSSGSATRSSTRWRT